MQRDSLTNSITRRLQGRNNLTEVLPSPALAQRCEARRGALSISVQQKLGLTYIYATPTMALLVAILGGNKAGSVDSDLTQTSSSPPLMR